MIHTTVLKENADRQSYLARSVAINATEICMVEDIYDSSAPYSPTKGKTKITLKNGLAVYSSENYTEIIGKLPKGIPGL